MFRRVEPPAPDPSGAPCDPKGLRVFAIEPTAVQLDWSALGPGSVRFRAADSVADVIADGGPGAVVLDGLPPGTDLSIHVDGAGMAGTPIVIDVCTPAEPFGSELFRFAAITDLHIGIRNFGKAGTLVERPEPASPHPVRCARAAIAGARSWGAELLLAKGDLTESSRPEHWAAVSELITEAGMPVLISPGNHETHRKNTVDPVEEARHHGLTILRSSAAVTDHPGVRIVRGDTPIAGADRGHIAHIADDIIEYAADSDRPVILSVHHQFQRWRIRTHLPPGIPGPEANQFLARLADVRPQTLITSGHTHRHRTRSHGPLILAETGSTKDYPGTWAGYVVHEGGIRQVVRRIDEPSCIRWTEWTGRAALGLWRHWSPGTLDDRCYSHTWP